MVDTDDAAMGKREQVVDLLTAMGLAQKRRGDLRRARAYMTAAREVARRADFDDLLREDRLRDVAGIGESIEETILRFVESGHWPEWARAERDRLQEAEEEAFEIPEWYFDAPFPGAPDLHVHTLWSDGTLTVEEVVLFAKRLGARAVGISDHSGSLKVARGLSPAEVLQQWEEIDRIQERHPDVKILKGTECDILRDGALDHPEHILSGFDYVIGSLHSYLKLPLEEQTERVLTAVENPYLTILGHPTTAVPGYRPAASLDFDRVFDTASRHDVAMEINGNPGRLDLPVDLARKALRAGCRVSIASDAHGAREMLSLAVAKRMADEAGATKERLVNFDVLRRATAAERVAP